MIKLLLTFVLSTQIIDAYPQILSTGYVQQTSTDTLAIKENSTEKIMVCQVLKLTNQNKETSLMAVFCETSIKQSKQRACMRNNYMLRRERIYLSKVFFADVEVIEERKVLMEVKPFFKLMEEKYAGLKLWSVINGETLFQ